MVQNQATDDVVKPRRGRPPAYDRDVALGRAGETFWRNGYSATTLDELGRAMQMNRPSLYAAFGDKHAIYLQALTRYAEASQQKLEHALCEKRPLQEQLMAVYDGALAIYLAEKSGPRGCFLVGTAVSEAVEDAAIRHALLAALTAMDRAYEARFDRARSDGELPVDADPRALAQVASAVLNALAVRARAGEPRDVLRTTARTAVALLCHGVRAAPGGRR